MKLCCHIFISVRENREREKKREMKMKKTRKIESEIIVAGKEALNKAAHERF